MKYDVVIVGGGPSGSAAGLNLAVANLRTLIIDRANFPRIKPCGGGISYRMFSRFDYLRPVFERIPTNLVHRVVLESPGGDVVEASDPEPLYAMIRRYDFDAALLRECAARGVEVRQDCTVAAVNVSSDGVTLVTTDEQIITTDLLIGADGVNSIVAIQSGMRGNWNQDAVAIDTTEESPSGRMNSPKDTMHVYYGFGEAYGYAYIFPKPEHVNFGIGYLLSYFREHIKSRPYIKHQELIERLRAEGVVRGESDPRNFHAYLLPVGGPLARVSSNRVLLAGDAAGFVNGFTAEGIYYAMVSGEHAGKVAAEAIRRRNFGAAFLRNYDIACDKEVGQELKQSVVIQRRLLGHPKRINQIVKLAAGDPELATLFTNFAVGKLSYSKLKHAVIPRALPWYLRYRLAKEITA
jgi:geranylgeranyl reductase family protein